MIQWLVLKLSQFIRLREIKIYNLWLLKLEDISVGLKDLYQKDGTLSQFLTSLII
jgi:hypothetical protein